MIESIMCVDMEMIKSMCVFVCAYFNVCLCVWCANSQLRMYM